MPGPFDLTNKLISSTFERIVQTDGAGNYYDGLGFPLSIGGGGTSGTSGTNGGGGGGGGTNGTSGTSGNGTSGTSGTSGANGQAGTSGTSGVNGTSGTSGTSGATGAAGIDGSSGTSGTSAIGTSGTSGDNGTSGTSGDNGTSGTSGISGNSGSSGSSGTSGATGTSGTSGDNGTSGTSGLDGTSGTSGTSGSSGISGTSGVSGVSSSVFDYRAKTTIQSGDPGDGYIIWDNATQISSTSISIDHLDQNNQDIDVLLGLVQVNQQIIIQDRNDSANYQIWKVNGTPTTVPNNYWTYPVVLVSSAGTGTTNFADTHELIILLGVQVSTSGVSGTSGTAGTSGVDGTSGTSGSSGTTGTSGSSGSSGFNGLNGSSGTSGSPGAPGLANASYWQFDISTLAPNDPGANSFLLNDPDLSLLSDVSISSYNVDGIDFSSWFLLLDYLINTQGREVYLQIQMVSDPIVVSISKVNSFIYNLTAAYCDINVTPIVSTGTVINKEPCLISWVYNGLDGAVGTSGTSGATGVSGSSGTSGGGTSGSSGSSGSSGNNTPLSFMGSFPG